jgi:hypothetical protein
LTITSIVPTGGVLGDFAQTNNCPASLPVSGTCIINVTFSPSSVTDQSAAITVTDNAPDSPQNYPVFGNGTAASVSLSATTVNFAAQTVGTTSAPQTVTLQNVGNQALTITGIMSFNTEFNVVNNFCPASLAPGAKCTFGVNFQPAGTGARLGFAMVFDNAWDSPQFIKLTGTGN